MKGDYWWDGSGEPDPEIKYLERLLGRFRWQQRELELPLRRRSIMSARHALAAGLVLAALTAGLWLGLFGNHDKAASDRAAGESLAADEDAKIARENTPVGVAAELKEPEPFRDADMPRRRVARPVPGYERKAVSEPGDARWVARPQLDPAPFLDLETIRHIEKVQLMLRSFKNFRFADGEPAFDIAYEKQQAQDLLIKNVLLRRAAEAKGNLLIESLLGNLEPLLLDIANLHSQVSQDEVKLIKERIRKKEIITALQVYLAPTLDPTL